MIKLKNEYMKLNEKDLILIGGQAGVGKTRFIVNEVNNAQKDNKVLFLSLEVSKEKLMYDYQLQCSNNLTIIDKKITLEELKKYTLNNIDYIYIDHLGILSNDTDIAITLKTLTNYINEFDLKVLMTDFISIKEKSDKYLNSHYNTLTSIYILKDTSIDKIK